MVIQRNMEAFNANRQLNMVEKAQAKSSEKLSSGYKVNRSADDAAGLSISEKMRKQIRGLTRAGENVEDGISLCQVIDGAMNEMHDMINRMNELAVQAANGTNSESDRADIQMEIDNIVTEFDRIIETTKFNEVYVFKEDKYFYTDADGGATKNNGGGKSLGEVDGVNVWTSPKLSDTFLFDFNNHPGWFATDMPAGAMPSCNRECAWVDFTDFKATSEADLIKQLEDRGFDSSCCFCKNRFYGIKFVSGLDAADANNAVTANGVGYNYHSSQSTQNGLYVNSEVLKINLKDIWDKYDNQTASSQKSLGAVICESLFNMISDAGKRSGSNLTRHYTSYAYEDGTARLYLFNNQGPVGSSNMSTFSSMPRDDNGYIESNEVKKEDPEFLDEDDIPIRKKQIFIQAGADGQSNNQIRINLPTMTVKALKLNRVKVLTEDLATDAIGLLTRAQRMVSADRSRIGAYQNRLEHTERNLYNVIENTTASESRIRDTDMADEMVRYANGNILMQSGQSVLSQANTRHQRVLSLLSA